MRFSMYRKLLGAVDSLAQAAQFLESNAGSPVCAQLLQNSTQLLSIVKSDVAQEKTVGAAAELLSALDACTRTVDAQKSAFAGGAMAPCADWNAFAQLRPLFVAQVKPRYRILFVAELGQKWDSMSSLYEAFKAREDCDVAVVLSPIFRVVRTPEGGVRQDVIYQDYLTPLGIPFLPFSGYHVEQDCPDMALISNPYESVTLREFWPEYLAAHTRLVYVPYFTERVVDAESIEAHCRMPVAGCAWRILAQSPGMKAMHEKYAPRRGENVLVTGLPKWDNIAELRSKPSSLPEGWAAKLRGRKVFLWNTHYSIGSKTATLLDYGRKLVSFFAGRRDLALIWRPHPMTATIFKLYHSEGAPLWNELQYTVQQADNMILDETVSYAPAFQCADALLSDFSSIMPQFMLTDKPALWLKRPPEAIGGKQPEYEYLIHVDSVDMAENWKGIEAFLERTAAGEDSCKEARRCATEEGMPFADGHVGERACGLLMRQLKEEYAKP